jgi:hypothetical protein
MFQLNGNVGIGTTAPGAKLQINSPDDSVSPALSIRQDNSPTYGWDFLENTLATGDFYLNRVLLGVSTNVMSFTRANGNVGIGTTSLPGTPKLGVNGTIGTYGLATDASNYQMGTLSASNGNGTLGSATLSCVRAGTGAVNCDINLTPLGTGRVVINAGANILYRCVGGTGDGLISVNNANASCPVGTWTATSLKIN